MFDIISLFAAGSEEPKIGISVKGLKRVLSCCFKTHDEDTQDQRRMKTLVKGKLSKRYEKDFQTLHAD